MARISKRGQFIIPKKLRDKLGWYPGDDVDFIVRDGEVYIIKRETGSATKQGGRYSGTG